jgi:hypothetical protein
MPRRVHALPAHRLHKACANAVVTIGGVDRSLVKQGTEESQAAYDPAIRQWLASGRAPTPAQQGGRTGLAVAGLPERYREFTVRHDRHEEKPSRKAGRIRLALKPLRRLYASPLASDSGPVACQAVRGETGASGLRRRTVNDRLGWRAREDLGLATGGRFS